MAACIGQVRMQGLVKMDRNGGWTDDRQHPLYYLVKVAKVALPLYPQFGTEPNGFYIPPRWVPRGYLEQMFGPGVQHAIDAYRRAKDDEKLAGLIQLFGSSPMIMERFEVAKGVARAYDQSGMLIADVPVVEPATRREPYDRKLDVYRLDVT